MALFTEYHQNFLQEKAEKAEIANRKDKIQFLNKEIVENSFVESFVECKNGAENHSPTFGRLSLFNWISRKYDAENSRILWLGLLARPCSVLQMYLRGQYHLTLQLT